MRVIGYLIILMISCVGCMQNGDLQNEKNYILIRTDSDNHFLSSKILVNKYDTSKRLILLFWDNGKVMSKGFFNSKVRDGSNENFYINGQLQNKEYYENGIKKGQQKKYYFNGILKSVETYENGKLSGSEEFDTLGNKIK